MDEKVAILKNPPLLETALSVIIKSPPLTMDAIGAFVDINAPGFTMKHEFSHQTFTIDPDTGSSSSNDPVPTGRQYMKEKNLVLLIQNKSKDAVEFVFSVLPPYTRWSDLYNIAKPILDGFLKTFNASTVLRIAIRSIDRLYAPYVGCPVTDIIKNVPPDIAGLHTPIAHGFRYQDTIYYPESDLGATVIRATQRIPNEPRYTVILDSDVFTPPGNDYSVDDIKPQLDKIVRLKDAIFFGSVGDKCMEKLK